MARSCPRSSASTTTSSSPPHLWRDAGCPAKFRDRGPARRAPRHRRHEAHRRRRLRADVRRRRPAGRLLGLRGPRLHQQAPRRRGRLRPRRHDDVADHLRRDAARLLRPEGARRRHGDELGRGVAVLPDVPPLLRPDLPRGEGPRARRGVRPRLQRLDGRGVVRRQRRPADPADASSRCGTPSSRPPRCGATRRAACTRCASARSRPTSACRPSTPATGTRSSPPARRRDTVVCMHIGSSSQMPATSADAPVAVAATLSFNNAMASLSDFLFSGVLVRFPDAEARVLRGPDRLAARTSSSGPTTCGASTGRGAA